MYTLIHVTDTKINFAILFLIYFCIILQDVILWLSTSEARKIFCFCSKTYINEAGKSLSTRLKEHKMYTRLDYVQSTVTEYQKTTVKNTVNMS